MTIGQISKNTALTLSWRWSNRRLREGLSQCTTRSSCSPLAVLAVVLTKFSSLVYARLHNYMCHPKLVSPLEK